MSVQTPDPRRSERAARIFSVAVLFVIAVTTLALGGIELRHGDPGGDGLLGFGALAMSLVTAVAVGLLLTTHHAVAYLILGIGFVIAAALILEEASLKPPSSDSAINATVTGYVMLAFAGLCAVGLARSLWRQFSSR